MTTDTIASIARELLDCRAAGRPIGAGAQRAAPADIAEAYAIQAAMEGLLTASGTRPIGYKIGATNGGARTALGVDGPFHGRLYDVSTSPSGVRLAHRPALYKMWEVEIAIELARDLDPADAPFDAADIEAATRALVPAIEVVGTVFDPWLEAGAANIISDNAVHGHWVAGTPVTDWSGFDLATTPIRLMLDGAEAARGVGTNVDGGPFGATAVIANDLARQGQGIRAGEFVTTGTVTPMIPVAAPCTVLADFGPLGQVVLTLAAE